MKDISVNLTTPEGRLSYCYLLVPRAGDKDKPDVKKYKTDLIFDPADPLWAAVVKTVFGVGVDAFGPTFVEQVKMGKMHCAIKRGIDRKKPDEAYGSNYFMQASTIASPTHPAPPIVDAQLNRVIIPEEVYAGCYARLAITVKPYNNKSTGVACYLRGTQITRKGQPLGGAGLDPAAEFGVVGGAPAAVSDDPFA